MEWLLWMYECSCCSILPLALLLVGSVCALRWLRYPSGGNRMETSTAPLASPHIPVFGNALEYKKSPTKFLATAANNCGPVFRINLAGMQTTIVSSRETIRQFAYASESILSSPAAIADIGFTYTLGKLNSENGAEVHKRIIKSCYFTKDQLNTTVLSFSRLLDLAVKKQLLKYPSLVINDFLSFIRKVILSVIISEMIGDQFSNLYKEACGGDGDLIDDFIVLQDGIEDATAMATVLPEWLALPFCLWSAESRRTLMVTRLQSCLESIWKAHSPATTREHRDGVWLSEIRQKTKYRLEANNTLVSEYSTREVAELIVGLLFAAHKNAGKLFANLISCI